MGKVTFQGRDGALRIYDGSTTPNYIEVVFSKMDFNGPLAKPRPVDSIVVTVGGYAHVPDGEGYEKAIYDPLPISFSCSVDTETNTWKLRDALCNPALNDPWMVGADTWLTTKGRGSIILPDGNYTGTQAFFDVMKQSVDVEILFSTNNQSYSGSPSWGLRYSEVYFPPQDQVMGESADEVTMKISGLIYGNITQIGSFRSGNES